MRPFENILAPACPLGLANVDTDQLIPARFMQTPRAEGYAKFLFHDLRRDEAGALRADFPVNDQRYQSARIMIASRNFGCGSSREAAVYVLADSGFACVAAAGFGDIFASNAAKNGVLAAVLSEKDAALLLSDPELLAGAPVAVDLASQTISTPSHVVTFQIREDRKLRLLNGWSDLDLTRSHGPAIKDYVTRDKALRPWAGAPDLARIGRSAQ